MALDHVSNTDSTLTESPLDFSYIPGIGRMGIMRTMRFLPHPSALWDNGDRFWLCAVKPGGPKSRVSVLEEVPWEGPRE